MDRRFAFFWVATILMLLALPVWAAPDYTQIERRVQSMHIEPGYHAFKNSTEKMVNAFEIACTSSAADDYRLILQGVFRTAMDDWQAIQHIRSGPVALNNRHSRLQFWPDKRSIGGRHLARFLVKGARVDLTSEKVSTASVALQGFPALERLLFDEMPLGVRPLPDEALSRCDVATAIAKNITAIAKDLVAESQRPQAFGPEPKLAVRGMVSDLITGIEVVQRLKLHMPVGDTKRHPKRAENWRSERSLRNIALNLQALRALALALNGPMENTDPEGKFIFDQFDIAIMTARNLGADMVAVLKAKDGALKLRSLALTLDDLKKLVAIYMTDRLAVNLGFNGLDGD